MDLDLKSAITEIGKSCLKTFLNISMPGSGSLVNFAQAGVDFENGENKKAVFELVLGTLDLFTLGYSSFSAKAGGCQAAKDLCKQNVKGAHKMVGKEASRKISNIASKNVIIKEAQEASDIAIKTMKKENGQLASTLIAKGEPKKKVILAAQRKVKTESKTISKKNGRKASKRIAQAKKQKDSIISEAKSNANEKKEELRMVFEKEMSTNWFQNAVFNAAKTTQFNAASKIVLDVIENGKVVLENMPAIVVEEIVDEVFKPSTVDLSTSPFSKAAYDYAQNEMKKTQLVNDYLTLASGLCFGAFNQLNFDDQSKQSLSARSSSDSQSGPTEDLIESTENLIEPTEDLIESTENLIEPTEDLIEPMENKRKHLDLTGFYSELYLRPPILPNVMYGSCNVPWRSCTLKSEDCIVITLSLSSIVCLLCLLCREKQMLNVFKYSLNIMQGLIRNCFA